MKYYNIYHRAELEQVRQVSSSGVSKSPLFVNEEWAVDSFKYGVKMEERPYLIHTPPNLQSKISTTPSLAIKRPSMIGSVPSLPASLFPTNKQLTKNTQIQHHQISNTPFQHKKISNNKHVLGSSNNNPILQYEMDEDEIDEIADDVTGFIQQSKTITRNTQPRHDIRSIYAEDDTVGQQKSHLHGRANNPLVYSSPAIIALPNKRRKLSEDDGSEGNTNKSNPLIHEVRKRKIR